MKDSRGVKVEGSLLESYSLNILRRSVRKRTGAHRKHLNYRIFKGHEPVFKKFEIYLLFAPRPLIIFGDPNQLNQLLLNLILNVL